MSAADIHVNWELTNTCKELLERAGHCAVAVQDWIYVLGGRRGSRFYNDVIRFCTKTCKWERLFHSLPFSPRANHNAALITSKQGKQQIWVFGGADDKVVHNDCWVLELDTLTWHQPRLAGNLLLLSRCAAAWDYHPLDPHSLLIFGGYGLSTPQSQTFDHFNSIARLDTAACTVEAVPVRGLPPSPRCFHTFTAVGTRCVVVGGRRVEEGTLRGTNMLAVYDAQAQVWAEVEVRGQGPLPRSSHRAVAVGGGQVLVTGGITEKSVLAAAKNEPLASMLSVSSAGGAGASVVVSWGGAVGQGEESGAGAGGSATAGGSSRKPQARGGHTATLHGDRVHIIGGYSGSHTKVYLPEVLTLRIGIAQPPPSGNGAAAINAPGRVSLSLTPPTASGKGASTPERGRLNLGARPGTPERPLPAATPANGITVIELDESEPGYGAKDAGGAACLKPQADAAPCRLSPLHGAAADGGGGWRTTKRQRSGGLDSGGLASLHQRSTTPPPHSPPRSLLQPQTLDPHAPTTRAGHPLPAAAGRQARSPTPPSPKRSRRGSEASPVAASTRAAARSRSPSPAGRGVGGRGMASGGVGVGVSRQAAVLPSGCAPAEAAQLDALRAEVARLNSQLQLAGQREAAATQRAAMSEQQVADLRAAHEVLGAAQGQAQAALREAKRELQSRDLTVDELQKQVRQSVAQITSHMTEQQSLAAQLAAAQGERDATLRHVQELEGRLAQASDARASAEAAASRAHAEMERRAAESTSAIEGLQAQLEKQRAAYNTLADMQQKSTSNATLLQQQLMDAQQRMHDAQRNSAADKEAAARQLDDARRAGEAARGEATAAQQRAEAAEEKLARLGGEHHQLQQRAKQLEADKSKLLAEVQSLSQALSEMRQQQDTLVAGASDVSRDIAVAMDALARAQGRVNRLEQGNSVGSMGSAGQQGLGQALHQHQSAGAPVYQSNMHSMLFQGHQGQAPAQHLPPPQHQAVQQQPLAMVLGQMRMGTLMQ